MPGGKRGSPSLNPRKSQKWLQSDSELSCQNHNGSREKTGRDHEKGVNSAFERIVDHRLRLAKDREQVFRTLEAFRVDFVNVLSA